MEGRVTGTEIAPTADLKMFLTATLKERTMRRARDLYGYGKAKISDKTILEIKKDIEILDSSKNLYI